ncbi:hypothetical protein Hanom_Chr12g01121971 [Helianthus anomalus]
MNHSSLLYNIDPSDAKRKYDNGGSVVGGARNAMTPGHSVNVKRSREALFQPYPGHHCILKTKMLNVQISIKYA